MGNGRAVGQARRARANRGTHREITSITFEKQNHTIVSRLVPAGRVAWKKKKRKRASTFMFREGRKDDEMSDGATRQLASGKTQRYIWVVFRGPAAM